MLAMTSSDSISAFAYSQVPLYPIPNEWTISPEQSFIAMALLFVVTFLIGSIPWGVIISQLFFKRDVRKEGSGNIGTTNVMRTMGKKGGIAVFLLDFGKGLLSGYIGMLVSAILIKSGFSYGIDAVTIAFLGCVWGHIFSPWLGFKGGKGIAVAIGCLFFAFGICGSLIEIFVFAIIVVATRYVSLGSIAAAVVALFITPYIYWGNWLAMVFMFIAALTIIWAHRSNIKRLLSGTENRVGSKKEK